MPTVESSIETRQRLLESAGEVFAENGFKAATIRDICKRAEANIAAVNYHFRDKNNLYREVFKYAQFCAGAKDFPIEVHPEGGRPKEERLRRYIQVFLARLFDTGRPSWHGKLMSREMVEPTGVLDQLIQDTIGPHYQLLSTIVQAYLETDIDPLTVRFCAGSVIGQILFYHHSRPVIERFHPDSYQPERLSQTVEHVFRFSHAALSSFAAERRRAGAAN